MNNKEINTKLILPNYENIKKHIEIFREQLKEDNKIEKEYFNNISILGERGSGKTHILFKLKNELFNDEENNIVLDIITPEVINKEEDLLGWIIVLLSAEVDKLEEAEKGKCQLYYQETGLRKSLNNLKSSYFIRREMYNSIIENNYSNKIDYIEQKDVKLAADVKLRKNFYEFINKFIEVYSTKKKVENPLLVFMFDDVDIYSSRVTEVLNIIMKYLSHKHIVSFIAGEYNGFIENITLELLKQEALLDEGIMNIAILEDTESIRSVRKKRAYELLKKVLPPKNRYKIPALTNRNKFKIIKSFSNECNIKKIINLLNTNISYGNEEICEYFDFMDNRIRGFMNIVDFINNQEFDWIEISDINSTKEIERYKMKTINILRSILEKIIDSSQILEEERILINKVINIPSNDFLETINNDESIEFKGYTNYYFIYEELFKKNNDKNGILKKSIFEKMYKIFILSNFMEILMVNLKVRDKTTIHGKEELVEILNSIGRKSLEDIKLFPNIDIKSLVYLKEKLFDKMKYEEIQRIYNENSSIFLRTSYLDLFKFYNNKMNLCEALKDIMDEDEEWTRTQIDWIYEVSFSEEFQMKKSFNYIKTICKDIELLIKINEYNKIKLHEIINNEEINYIKNSKIKIKINTIKDLGKLLFSINNYKNNIDFIRKNEIKRKQLIKEENKYNQVHKKINKIKNETDIYQKYEENKRYFENNIEKLKQFDENIIIYNFRDDEREGLDPNDLEIKYLNDKEKNILFYDDIKDENYCIKLNEIDQYELDTIQIYCKKKLFNYILEKYEFVSYEDITKKIEICVNEKNRIGEEIKEKEKENNKCIDIIETYIDKNYEVLILKLINNEEIINSIANLGKQQILNRYKNINNTRNMLLQLELAIVDIYKYSKENIFTINRWYDSYNKNRIPVLIKRELNTEILTNEKIKIILSKIKFFKKNQENNSDYIRNNDERNIVFTERVNRFGSVLDMEMDLLNELEKRDNEFYKVISETIKECIKYLTINYILVDLQLNEKEMSERVVNDYINNIRNTLSTNFKNAEEFSRIREYLKSKEK